MVSIKEKILFPLSFSILFTYAGMLYLNYDGIPETIPTHINFKGEIDRYGNKIQLWIATGINLILLLTLYLAAKFPKYWNIPFKPKNLVVYIKNTRIFFGILSILVSCTFSTMILFSLKYTTIEMLKFFLLILIIPVLFITFFKEKSNL